MQPKKRKSVAFFTLFCYRKAKIGFEISFYISLVVSNFWSICIFKITGLIIDLILWARCKILNLIVPSFRLWPWNVCLPINESFWAEHMNRFLVLFLTIPRLNRCFNHFETISVENNNLGWIWAIFPKGEKWDFSIPTHYRLPFSFMTTLPLSDNISINRES